MPLVADVAVPVPLAHAFTYEVPASLAGKIKPGSRVLCDFGKRRVLGVALAVHDREVDRELRPIAALIDPEPVIPIELLDFLRELSVYYFAPIGEVLRLALPAVEREREREIEAQGELIPKGAGKRVGGKKIAFAKPTSSIEAPGSLRGNAAAILAALRANGEEPVARLADRFSNARAAVDKLKGLGLVTVEDREAPRDPFFAEAAARSIAPSLNDAQAVAAQRIEASIRAPAPGEPRAFLLFGVTGSGKTEVYLRAIAACLAEGRGALMMVPEIALTPQLVSRFRSRFGDDLAVLHSGLGDVDRHAMWTRLRRGEVRVAIGARSALFAPVPSLGLIIVDEEHDHSFKQEEGVRYHARDMALLRAHRAGASVVLGSATPSLEAVELAQRNKLVELTLPDRAVAEASLPKVSIIDLRRIGAGPSGERLISLPLHRAIEETLKAGEQVILFLNRRGFAPSVVCEACGGLEVCRACSVALTYHRRSRSVVCHYCDFSGPLPERCSSCGAGALALEGLGTEKLEDTIAAAFPSAKIGRLDRDVASGARSRGVMDKMRAGEIDILVGTQMVTKGHDLPRVTLVGVLNADAALALPDFRASERGFSLLVQVAGRAGRSDRPGRVLIQTRNPDHPAIRFAAGHDVPGFLARELVDRREVGYPPFVRIALVRVDAIDEGVARAAAADLAAAARTSREGLARQIEVLGPSAAPIARLRGRFRFRVLIRAADRALLRRALKEVSAALGSVDRRARALIDVDPVSML